MNIIMKKIALLNLLILWMVPLSSLKQTSSCHISEIFMTPKGSSKPDSVFQNTKNPNKKAQLYILYDIHQVEGFNLRRDVYIRMATFVWSLRQKKKYRNTKLVLPPFTNMYHWRSHNVDQSHVFWGEFFDLESLRRFTGVLDFPEFLQEIKNEKLNAKTYIDEVYKLQNYDDMFENGVFRDKFEKSPCKNDDERRKGHYYGFKNLTHRTFTCVNFQGGAKMLESMLDKYKTNLTNDNNQSRIVLILRSELVLHDFWSTSVYWKARRSMRFSKTLTKIANKFRFDYFNSTNESDLVQRPDDWRNEKPYTGAKGGDYLAVHLRRADFLYGREKTVPSLQSAATQIKNKLKELNLGVVFVASDCTGNEFNDLKGFLRPYKVVKFKPESKEQFNQIKDGGMAIIDQIICSHARYFIGTYESTFTFRIYEERDIMGFDKQLTYNTFCKREDLKNCEHNTVWSIIY